MQEYYIAEIDYTFIYDDRYNSLEKNLRSEKRNQKKDLKSVNRF